MLNAILFYKKLETIIKHLRKNLLLKNIYKKMFCNCFCCCCFRRKSVSGNWKANVGSALLEQISFNDRYKKWIDNVSDSFGCLDICSLEGIIDKDGKEFIVKVRGSDMALLGDTQEEDRKNIVELIIQRMNAICKNILM